MENQTLVEYLETLKEDDMSNIFLKDCELCLKNKYARIEFEGAHYLIQNRGEREFADVSGPFATIAETEFEAQKSFDAACEERRKMNKDLLRQQNACRHVTINNQNFVIINENAIFLGPYTIEQAAKIKEDQDKYNLENPPLDWT